LKTDFTSAATLTDPTLHLSRCFCIVPVMGVTPIGPFRFTDHDASIVVSGQTPSDLNGTYVPVDSVTPSAAESESDMSVDNMEIVGHIRVGGIEDGHLRAGLFDGAKVWVFAVDWKLGVVAQGIVRLRRGWLGNIKQRDYQWTMELRGLTQKLATQIVEMYSAPCPADFCDARCGLSISSYDQADTVATEAGDNRTFTVTTAGAGNWGTGHVRFDTGNNAGLSREIKAWTLGTKEVVVHIALPYTIQVGDTCTMFQGCGKALSDCQGYSNVINFRAFPHVPHADEAFRTPDAPY
jgi:uncharacterized phage protein (TIGR02218 family)